MEYNNLSKELVSLDLTNEFCSSVTYGSSQSRNITTSLDAKRSIGVCTDDVAAQYSTPSRHQNKFCKPVLSSESHFEPPCSKCGCSRRCKNSANQHRNGGWTVKIHRGLNPDYINTGHVSHFCVMNDGGFIQMGKSNTMNVTYGPDNTRNFSKTRQASAKAFTGTQKGPRLKKLSITASQKLLDERNIEMLCKSLGVHWKQLALELNFTVQEVCDIEVTYQQQGLYEIIWQFLVRWQDRAENEATFCAMADALIAIKKYDIAVQLKVS